MTTRRTRTGQQSARRTESRFDAYKIAPDSNLSDGKRLGVVIKTFRTRNPIEEITQDEMARRAGVTRNTVMNFEKGATSFVRGTQLNSFAIGMGIDVGKLRDLMGMAENPDKVAKVLAIAGADPRVDLSRFRKVFKFYDMTPQQAAHAAMLYVASLREPEIHRAMEVGQKLINSLPADHRGLFD